MAYNYIGLVNDVNRRLNEVELKEKDFPNAIGEYGAVKEAVNSAIRYINQHEFEWPFNAAEHTETLVAGQEEYTWPEYFKVADWNTFQIQEDSSLGATFTTLKFIERDEWYRSFRDRDAASGATGISAPVNVFSGHGNGFGVSPSPDKAYTLKFRYFLNYSDLSNADHVTRIPTSYDTVLIDGATYYLYIFKFFLT